MREPIDVEDLEKDALETIFRTVIEKNKEGAQKTKVENQKQKEKVLVVQVVLSILDF